MLGCHSVMSHDKCRKVVHRPCSSCISSIQNSIGTLLSSSCQLGLGVWLSYLRLSHYIYSNQMGTLLSSPCQLGLGVVLRHYSLSSYIYVMLSIPINT